MTLPGGEVKAAVFSAILALSITSPSANETAQQHVQESVPVNSVSQRPTASERQEHQSQTGWRKSRLGDCFLSHVLHSRIEVNCDEDLFFAPLHRSFYAHADLPLRDPQEPCRDEAASLTRAKGLRRLTL